jgi:uncharacterized protein
MEFDNSFEVPLPPADAWAILMDIERIAPCMPGAELTEVVDKSTYKGKISVRLGPVALAFAGTVKFESVDDANHTATIKAQGTDAKGRGGAQASAAFRLEPTPNGSKVLVHTDLSLSGAVAQYGRGVGIIQATANQLITQFADCLKTRLAQSRQPATDDARSEPVQAAAPLSPAGPATPISGFALIGRVIWDFIARLFPGRSRGS